MSDFYSSKEHKAKKEHRCSLCEQTIEIGKKYSRCNGVFQGDFYDDCFHTHCLNMIDSYCSESGECEYDYDGINDWLRETYCQDCDKKEDCEIRESRCGEIMSKFETTE